MNHLRRIKNEYNEPAVDVITGFAEMGYSRHMTAKILGMDYGTLKKICERYDLTKHFKPPSEFCAASRPGNRGNGGMKKGQHNPKKPTYSDQFLLYQVKKYGHLSTRMFTVFADVSISTIYDRFGSFSGARRMARKGIEG
jgi:hypothetical protein